MDARSKWLRVFVFFSATTLLTKVIRGDLLGGDSHIAGPCDIIIRSIQECPKRMRGDDIFRLHSSTGFYKKNRMYEYLWSTNASVLVPIDDEKTAEIHLSQWTPRGGWKTGVKNMRFPQPCSFLQRFAGRFWEDIVIAVYGEKKKCPIPTIKYATFNNLSLNTRFFHLREFIYGRWRSDVLLLSGEKTKGCMRVFVDIAPRAASDD